MIIDEEFQSAMAIDEEISKRDRKDVEFVEIAVCSCRYWNLLIIGYESRRYNTV